MSEQNGMGAAARLRAHIETLEAVIVDVKAPSGFLYKFEKPNKFSLLFEMGELPQETSSSVVEKWIADGIVKPEANGEIDDSVKIIDSVLTLLEKTAHYSREPKIVFEKPKDDNEILPSEMPPTDLEYLMQWVKAGGETAAMLATFPSGPRPGSLAKFSRRKVRTAA